MAQAGLLTCVIDASALLALVLDESGAAPVTVHVVGANMSAVNVHEVLTRLLDLGHTERLLQAREIVGRLTTHAFDIEAAERAAAMRDATRKLGLSLGDRACLELAQRLQKPVLTSDRRMAEAQVGVRIQLIR